ncbi:MAG: hypothetical protein P4L46_19530 [Fimbriimonas sp.]|nr:hypothetical protein [Fimbriimonas sp.]
MSSIPLQNIEGTGAEISEYAKLHPTDRFRLIMLEDDNQPTPFDQAKWDRVMASINSVMGQLPALQDDAMSTDSLYD